MKRIILFCFVYILFYFHVNAQLIVSPLGSDPSRAPQEGSGNSRFRVAATAYRDTLPLPFFEDFTSLNASIDSIYFLNDQTIRISTLGHHGLSNQEEIELNFQEKDASYLNGVAFARIEDKFSFTLFKDASLTTPFSYPSVPNIRFHGYWNRPGAKLGPGPDFVKWVDSGGVFVNNNLCINPPSRYVASFDGLNFKGNPYSATSQRGLTDQLCSRPIDLSGLGAGDSVVLSFYWQVKGNGFLPTRKDSFYLEFKDTSGIWNYAWSVRRVDNKIDTTAFYKTSIKILDSAFLYNGFQFRFQSFGNLGAAAENWNLDYIYLDKNWNDSKSNPRDRAISQSQSPLLKNYQSMPFKQFDQFRGNELADSVGFTLRNLSAQQTIIYFDKNDIYDGDKSIKMNFGQYNQLLDQEFAAKNYNYSFDKAAFTFSADSLVVKTIVSIQSSDPDRLNGIDFTTNNVDSTSTYFYDYFAYDDGSAEKSGNNINGGPMLIKYTLNKVPDTLTSIDICVIKAYTFNNPSYAQFDLIVADKDKNIISSGTVKGFKPTYPGGVNTFSRAEMPNGYVVINDPEFYIGYINPYPSDGQTNINIPIGMDWTYPQKGEVYYKNRGFADWVQYTGGGNYMIRPVFKRLPLTPVTDAQTNDFGIRIYPNPSSGTITVTGLAESVILLDPSGRKVFQELYADPSAEKTIRKEELPNGVYFVQVQNGGRSYTSKLVIMK